jgi:hypothetical protein
MSNWNVFDKFLKYYMKIMLGVFSSEVGREYIFKTRIRSETLHEISNENGVRIVTLPYLQISLSKVRFSQISTSINILGHLQMGKPTIRLTIF